MSSHALEAGVTSVSKEKNLNDEFSRKVIKLMRYCYQVSEIAWTLVPGTGSWRAFEGQEGVSSNAGYGESIHAYGYAADISTRDLTWVDSNAELHTSAMSFTGMSETHKQEFLNARNAIAKTREMGLFGTILPGDFWHLQNYDDAKVGSVSLLMALLHQFGPRKMKWEPVYMTPTNYHCDLGLGGRTYFVGTSGDIWKMNPANRISRSDLVAALTAKKKVDPKFSVDTFLSRPEHQPPVEFKESDIGEREIVAVQRILKDEFVKASAQWKKWKPVYYPDEKRRPLNPANPKNKKKG
ncbi:MAG TPA: hypothetical protein VJV78_00510 [Polyangiales bacterium]|nr:hypothetical protein [Polyangiales bacterium]